jgi:hypothetical protein
MSLRSRSTRKQCTTSARSERDQPRVTCRASAVRDEQAGVVVAEPQQGKLQVEVARLGATSTRTLSPGVVHSRHGATGGDGRRSHQSAGARRRCHPGLGCRAARVTTSCTSWSRFGTSKRRQRRLPVGVPVQPYAPARMRPKSRGDRRGGEAASSGVPRVAPNRRLARPGGDARQVDPRLLRRRPRDRLGRRTQRILNCGAPCSRSCPVERTRLHSTRARGGRLGWAWCVVECLNSRHWNVISQDIGNAYVRMAWRTPIDDTLPHGLLERRGMRRVGYLRQSL